MLGKHFYCPCHAHFQTESHLSKIIFDYVWKPAKTVCECGVVKVWGTARDRGVMINVAHVILNFQNILFWKLYLTKINKNKWMMLCQTANEWHEIPCYTLSYIRCRWSVFTLLRLWRGKVLNLYCERILENSSVRAIPGSKMNYFYAWRKGVELVWTYFYILFIFYCSLSSFCILIFFSELFASIHTCITLYEFGKVHKGVHSDTQRCMTSCA